MDRFGVPQLDRLLPPIPAGTSVLFVNDPGIEAEPFLYQAADSHLREGRSVVYAVFNRTPSSVRRAMRDFGFHAGERLLLVDGQSGLLGPDESADYHLEDPTDLAALAALLAKVATEHPDAVLFIDPLSTLIDQGGFERFQERFGAVHESMKRFPLSAALFTRWPYEEDVAPVLSRFDALVRLRGVEDRVVLSQYFTIERADWATRSRSKPVLYKTLRPGGVFAYIPKIVVTGPFHSGKSTFIHTLSDTAVSVNRLGTTVALDHGHVTIDGLTADVFGTPGQERFDPVLKIIAGQALGVIVVVDATRPDTFERAKEMMAHTWKQGLPIVVAANKQDMPRALPADEVKRRLAPPSHVKVVGCDATDKAASVRVLRELIHQIMGGLDE